MRFLALASSLAFIVSFAWPLAPPTTAQEPAPASAEPPSPAAVEEADHEALRSLRRVYEEAAAKGDPAPLEPYLAPGFTGVMINGDEITSYAGLAEFWREIQRQMGSGGRYSVVVKPAAKSLLFGDLAVARGSTEDLVVTGGGRELRFTSQWTAVCQKLDGRWKILRVQGTVDPIENPFVGALLKARGLAAGAGGLVAGLLLGFLVGRRRRPRGTTA